MQLVALHHSPNADTATGKDGPCLFCGQETIAVECRADGYSRHRNRILHPLLGFVKWVPISYYTPA